MSLTQATHILHVRRIIFLVSILLTIAIAISSATHAADLDATLSNIEADLERVRSEITIAEEEARAYSSGLINGLIVQRLQTLKLTEAILDQKHLALRDGIDTELKVPSTEPDPKREAEIVSDLVDAQSKLRKAEAEADRHTGGLVQIIALTTVATHRQTVAMLTQAALASRYGLYLSPITAPDNSVARSRTSTTEDAPTPPASPSIEKCLEIEDFGSRTLDVNEVFAKVAWKVDVSNMCDRAIRVQVRFYLTDEDEFEIDDDTETITVSPNQIGKARGEMLVSPASNYSRAKFNGVSLQRM